ncbi:response regulator [Serpentinicella alkaliphila]|uniref:Stage 0 sporulation protein A homolog n=1 Tax=Serpentinicella alkaliphila TaxID=1734049 RepID=A0A4R2TY77_9FIRM|nr:response regulator transcription factor [Serpentinicella alkaliphila]QUH24628.1 response regulator transcription factor [Serpentinicella alkaliphila]TCQ02629.1 LuxR family two component transcriptional regulator [Serpentinicella alkaliphila]
MSDITKILLVDDHAVVRWGIKSVIERNPKYIVCAEAETLEDAYEKVKDLMPDIVILDLKLPDGDGVTGCRKMKAILPNVKVMILTAYGDDQIIVESIRAGADGFLLKNIDSNKIISAIHDVSLGKSIYDSAVINKVISAVRQNNEFDNVLSNQEKKILDLICEGKTNKEISERLFIAEKTVRNNVTKIMKKINVNNRTEAAIYWSRQKSLF